jgi:MraZ protein
MFLGRHEHSLDDKGRLVLPTQMRPLLADGLIISLAPGQRCLRITPEAEFRSDMVERRAMVKQGTFDARTFSKITANSFPMTLDSQGRVGVPQMLREAVGLDRSVSVIGVLDFIEVWDPQQWDIDQASETELANLSF